jgi:hypothetical protein
MSNPGRTKLFWNAIATIYFIIFYYILYVSVSVV